MIETQRLIMRPITAADIPDIFAYAKNQNVGPRAGWKPHGSIEESAEISRNIFIEKEFIYGIAQKSDNKVIGSIGLVPDELRKNDRSRTLGYAIGEEHWGRGFMTECAGALLEAVFSDTEFDIISATCYTDNPASRKVLLKCGFREDGIIRQAETLYNGELKDIFIFSITKEEYSKKNN